MVLIQQVRQEEMSSVKQKLQSSGKHFHYELPSEEMGWLSFISVESIF